MNDFETIAHMTRTVILEEVAFARAHNATNAVNKIEDDITKWDEDDWYAIYSLVSDRASN